MCCVVCAWVCAHECSSHWGGKEVLEFQAAVSYLMLVLIILGPLKEQYVRGTSQSPEVKLLQLLYYSIMSQIFYHRSLLNSILSLRLLLLQQKTWINNYFNVDQCWNSLLFLFLFCFVFCLWQRFTTLARSALHPDPSPSVSSVLRL